MGGFRRIAVAGALLLLSGGHVFAQDTPQPPLGAQPEAAVEQPEADATDEQDTAQEPAGAPNLAPALQGIEAAIRELIAEPDHAARERQEKREIEDLEAQKAMARWALPMLVAAALSVAVTFVGVLLVKRTLHYTKEAANAARAAVNEARNATRAAEETVVVTRGIGTAQLRAYLVLERLEMEPTAGHGGLPRIRMVFKNCGATPSRKGRMRYGFNVFGDPEDVPGPDGLEVRNLPDLAPGQEFFDEYMLDRQDWAKWKEPMKFRAAALYAYGQIEYETVFPDGGHFTNFRLLFSSVGRQFPEGRFFACPDGNDSD